MYVCILLTSKSRAISRRPRDNTGILKQCARARSFRVAQGR